MRRLLTLLGCLLALGAARAEVPAGFEAGMRALLAGNFAEAYCRWKPLAERGHAESQYHLGWLFANGNGMNVDMEQAFRWWRKAAEQGHADAEFALGLDYMTGEGRERDLEQAARWLYRAARHGHPDAREVLLRLAGDPAIDLLAHLPELADAPWFGWWGRVKGDRINLRAGPGKRHRIVGQLRRGQQVRVLGRSGNWLRIRLPGEDDAGKNAQPTLAWVYHSLLEPVPAGGSHNPS